MGSEVFSEFATMAQQLYEEPDVEGTVDKIAEFAKDALDCDYVGVMLVHSKNHIETAAATSPIVDKADALQVELQEGPCLEAIVDNRWFLIRDTAQEERWHTWCQTVAEFGIRSVLSMQLAVGSARLGALNVYAVDTDRFTRDDIAVAGIFAGHASVALGAARDEDSLREAIDARHVIGQAQGILMERYSLDAGQAFSILRRYSQNKNLKLRLVAEQLIASRSLPS